MWIFDIIDRIAQKRQSASSPAASCMRHFENIEYGRQGDDWIWVHLADDKIEIDSFFSMNLEVRGKSYQYQFAMQILRQMKDDWILRVFDPPKIDTTR
jgi:hypothetical protein